MPKKLTILTTLLSCALVLSGCANIAKSNEAAQSIKNQQAKLPNVFSGTKEIAMPAMTLPSEVAFSPALVIPFNSQLSILSNLLDIDATNPSMALAYAKLKQAEGSARQSGASRYPNVNYKYTQTDNKQETTNLEQHQLLFGWELDLFGRLSDSANSASNLTLAREADLKNARLSLQYDLLTAYLQWRKCEESVALQEQDIVSREKVLSILTARYKNGLVSKQDYSKMAGGLADAKYAKESAHYSCELIKSELFRLSDQNQGLLKTENQPSFTNLVMQFPPAKKELDLKLLQHRPDLLSLEAQIQSSLDNYNYTDKSGLPTLNLTGTLGSTALGMNPATTAWQVLLGASLVLLDGGKQEGATQLAEGKLDEALATYALKINQIIKEVQDILQKLKETENKEREAKVSLEHYQQYQLSVLAKFKHGLVSAIDVEDAFRQTLTSQQNYLAVTADRSLAWINLHRSMGLPIIVGDVVPPPLLPISSKHNPPSSAP